MAAAGSRLALMLDEVQFVGWREQSDGVLRATGQPGVENVTVCIHPRSADMAWQLPMNWKLITVHAAHERQLSSEVSLQNLGLLQIGCSGAEMSSRQRDGLT